MTTGKKSLKERVARIANAPKMSVIAVILALCVAAAAVGCTFSGKSESAPVEPEIAVETAQISASAIDVEAAPAQMSVVVHDPATGNITSIPTQDRELVEAMYALYRDLLDMAVMPEPDYEFPIYETFYNVKFLDEQGEYAGEFQVYETGLFLLNRPDMSEIAAGIYEAADGALTGRFRDILRQYGYMDIIAQGMGAEPIGTYDREYWEEVDRELEGFAELPEIEVYVSEYFDEALPADDKFGPLTMADYIYGTDGWKFDYDGPQLANAPEATIRLRDADGRELWIMDDADALMIVEADGSLTWVTYASDPVDCVDMIRHLLPWTRGEFGPPLAADMAADTPGPELPEIPLTFVQILYEGREITSFMESPGRVVDLDCAWTPMTAQPDRIRWESSDDSVATVDGEGRVTAIAPGYCTVTVWADNLSNTCEVYVM